MLIVIVNMPGDSEHSDDSDNTVVGYDPFNGEWVSVKTKNRRNERTLSKISVGTYCDLETWDGGLPGLCSNCKSEILCSEIQTEHLHTLMGADGEAQRLGKSIQHYTLQLKHATETQSAIGKAISDGQKELEKVVQSQARMIESMVRKHNDSQLSCIAQVSGLSNTVVDVTEAKLDSITNELAKLSANLQELSSQVGHLQETTRQLTPAPAGLETSGREAGQHHTEGTPSVPTGSSFQLADPAHHLTTQRQIVGMVDEYMDRQTRRKNVVVFNLPESTAQTPSDRKKDDLDRFIQLVRDELHLIVSPEKCYRVGQRNDTRSRLLIVTLESEDVKWDVLRQAPQLKQSKHFPRIYINPDLSMQERTKAKQLRQELARRKASGEHDIKIQRGKIVRYNKAQSPDNLVDSSTAGIRQNA